MAGIFENLQHVFKGALRAGQTASALAEAGVGWALGDRPPAPALLRRTFEKLGATYIKLGQFIASSPSLFPPEYVEEFEKCLDRTDPLPYAEIARVIQRELGRRPEEIFESFERDPLASASIAQVHAARLKNGRDVVVKVQKPGVDDVLLTDLNFLFVAAKLLEWLAPGFARTSLSNIISDVQKTMLEECDFLKEAANIDEFRRFLDQAGITDATAPQVYREQTSLRVLTMERFYGAPLTDLESIRRYSQNPEQTLVNALNTWFASLMLCNFFHADVHAGNLMALEDGRIGFIDFGIVGRIKKDTWLSMNSLMEAMGREDYPLMARSLAGIGATDEAIDVNRFAADLEALFTKLNDVALDARGEMALLDERELNRVMIQMVEIGERHGLRFPREFALLMKQMLYFDRYIRILAPGMDLFQDARLQRLLGD